MVEGAQFCSLGKSHVSRSSVRDASVNFIPSADCDRTAKTQRQKNLCWHRHFSSICPSALARNRRILVGNRTCATEHCLTCRRVRPKLLSPASPRRETRGQNTSSRMCWTSRWQICRWIRQPSLGPAWVRGGSDINTICLPPNCLLPEGEKMPCSLRHCGIPLMR